MSQKQNNISKIVGSNKPFKDILEDILPEGESPPMKQGKNKMILALSKNDEGLRYLSTHRDQKVRELIQARTAVKSWKLHIKRVQNMVNMAKASNDLLPIPLKYYGGHTGRWSGTGGINSQNFGGKGRGKPLHPLISQVKRSEERRVGKECRSRWSPYH